MLEKEWENNKTLKFFKFQIMREMTRLNHMVIECTRLNVKIKFQTYQFMINQSN